MAKKDIYSYQKEGGYSFFGDPTPGAIDGLGQGADWNKLATYANPGLEALEAGATVYMSDLLTEVSGVPVKFIDGSVSAPGASWGTEITSGLYKIGTNRFGFAVNATLEVEFNSSGLLISDMTQNSVLFAGAGGQVSQDAGLTYLATTDLLIVAGELRVGTATDTSTVGDVVFGVTGGSRLFFDQSAQSAAIYDSSNNQDILLKTNGDSWYNGTGSFGFGTTTPDAMVDIEGTVLPQLRLTHTNETFYCDITCPSSGVLAFEPTGYGLALGMYAAAADVYWYIANFDDSSLISNAKLRLEADTGDAVVEYATSSGPARYWTQGGDSSAGGAFKLSSGQVLGTNDRLTFTHGTTGGFATFTPGAASSGTSYGLQVTGPIFTGGTNGLFKVLAGASTGQTASTEIRFIDLDLSATVQWATGALTNERAIYISAPTLRFVGASTVTNAATVYINNAPQPGTNATITNAYALWVDDGAARFDGALSAASFTVSGLTNTRVLFAGAGGAITDDAGFTFDGITLTISDSNAATTPLAILNQASTGDSTIRWSLATTASYIAGIDNSDSDSWKLSYAASGTAVLGTNDYLEVATSGRVRVLVGDFHITRSAVGSTVTQLIDNSDNTNAASSAVIQASVGGSSAGDPYFLFTVAGVTSWSCGVDNSDSDKMKWSQSAVLGTGDLLTLSTAGQAVIFGRAMVVTNVAEPSMGSEGFAIVANDQSITRIRIRNTTAGRDWAIVQGLNGASNDGLSFYDGTAGLTRLAIEETTGNIIGNDSGADADFRWESDDESYCLMVEGTLNNIVLCANAEPAFQSMDGGVYLSNANVVPAGDPTGGGYLYAEAGALKWRGTSGTVTTIAAA